MAFTPKDKEALLIQFFELVLSDDPDQFKSNDIYKQVNWTTVAFQNKKDVIQFVCERIPAHELYSLMYHIYDALNAKFSFDTQNVKKMELSYALQLLVRQYANEAKKSFPFYTSYLSKKNNDQTQIFQNKFIAESLMDERTKAEKEAHLYGLVNKILKNDNVPFKEVLFSKKHNIRKFLTNVDHGFFGRLGVHFLGTQQQINDLEDKLTHMKMV